MNKPNRSKEHPQSPPHAPDSATDASRQGLDRDAARKTERDNMVTETNTPPADHGAAPGGGSVPPADPTTGSAKDRGRRDSGTRTSIESPVDDSAGTQDEHSGTSRDTMGVGGRGQG